MPWFNRHRRFLDQISAYIDGQIGPAEIEALEAHLASCPSCRRHLEELRATVLALRDLPQEEAPRSFALTPEQVAQPSLPCAPVAPALSFGLRLAGAALAFALAVVLVIDLGDLGGQGQDGAAIQTEPAEIAAPAREAAPTEGDQYAAGVPTEPADDASSQFDAEGGPQTGEAEPPPPEGGLPLTGEAPVPRALTPVPEAGIQEAVPSSGGGGLDPLRATEIALAATLGLLVGGSLTLAFARRKR